MKKSLLSTAAVAALIVAPAAFAQSGDSYRPDLQVGQGNGFVAGTVGRTDGGTASRFGTGDFNVFESRDGRKTGYSLTGGYRWKVSPNVGIGVEGGYADLGNIVVRNAFRDEDVDQRESTNALRGWLAGGNIRANINPQWYVSGRGGFFRASDNDITYYNTVGETIGVDDGSRDGRNSWYAGIGTGWNATENLSIGLHYDYYRAKSGRVSIPDTNISFEGPKRSTAVLGLSAEYAF
ncbi:MAG: outer membrane beta-barrel protein [Pseudoxanthomonas suwonensis]|nr:outer membrane beta-barrel protein [Pseudoxanthomonas suwonensis]